MSPYNGAGVDPYRRSVVPVLFNDNRVSRFLRPGSGDSFPVDTVGCVNVQVDDIIDALELKGYVGAWFSRLVLIEGLVTVILDDAFPKGVQVFRND